MTTVDISDPLILQNIKAVQDGSIRWVSFGYVPRTANKIKMYESGTGDLKELKEELVDNVSTIRYAYMSISINNMNKFLYVAWCGDGVAGPIKGSFSSHAIDFAKYLKPIHHQLNARNEDDVDEAAIMNALNKATGASYDSGAKIQGSTKAFVPTSVAQGREHATKSNAEVKNIINKNDYNKTNESSEYWKQNQAVKEDVKPQRTEYKLTQERDQYWRDNQQQQPQQQQTATASKPTASAPSRTVANKFQQSTAKPVESVSKPTPTRSVANKFPQSNASTSTSSHAPPPPRSTKPVVQPQYEEPQYEEPQYEEPQYEEPQYEEPQYEEPQYEEPQQEQYDDQSYQQQEQSYDDQQQEQSYDDQQQYDDQSYQQQEQSYDDQQQYDDQAQDHYVQALYDYEGENEGDLSFKQGEHIKIIDQSDPDGWWVGEVNGVQGSFPCNFVQ